MSLSADCPAANWTALLLAGGQSTRMGVDKRHLPIRGLGSLSLVEHASALLGELCAQRWILVPSAAEANLPHGFQVVADRQPGQGPLLAISDAVQHLDTAFALILPVDMPCLQKEDLAAWMVDFEQSPTSRAARFALEEQQRPTFPVLLRREFASSLADQLRGGQLRLFQGLRAAGAEGIAPQWQSLRQNSPNPFLNLNRPADLEQLESVLKPPCP